MNFALNRKLGNIYKNVIGTVPVTVAAGVRNGVAIDRRVSGSLAMGLTLAASIGAETGSPSARTFDAKVQDSADGSTGWADYIPPDQATVAAIAQLTAVSTIAEVDVNLEGAKRYVRVVDTLAFTGGSTPTAGIQSTVQLYGFDRTPQ